jgi:hypothetical protein
MAEQIQLRIVRSFGKSSRHDAFIGESAKLINRLSNFREAITLHRFANVMGIETQKFPSGGFQSIVTQVVLCNPIPNPVPRVPIRLDVKISPDTVYSEVQEVFAIVNADVFLPFRGY